jgi:hypothetical protein
VGEGDGTLEEGSIFRRVNRGIGGYIIPSSIVYKNDILFSVNSQEVETSTLNIIRTAHCEGRTVSDKI